MKHAASIKILRSPLLICAAAILASSAEAAAAIDRKITDLPEIVVESRQRPVLYLTGYVREYSALTGTGDTVFLFREKMVDFMIPGKHTGNYQGWRTPRMLATKSYYRFTNSEGLDSVSDSYREHFSWSDWVGILRNTPIPQSMRSLDALQDTIFGKYSPSQIWRRSDGDMQLEIDVLADSLNRRSVPGAHSMIKSGVDFNRFMVQYDFSAIGSTEILADNISRISYAIEANGRDRDRYRLGQKKSPRYMDTYAEIYIVDRRYLSVKEARRLEKHPPRDEEILITVPVDAPEVEESIRTLMARVDGIDHDQLRLDAKLDNRLHTIPMRRLSFVQKFQHKMKSLKNKASRILRSFLE